MREVRSARWIAIGACAAFVLVVGRVAQLKLMPSERLLETVGSHASVSIEHGLRGRILDRSGRILAASTFGWALFVDPQLIRERAWDDPAGSATTSAVADPLGRAAELLAAALRVPAADIAKKLRDNADRRFLVLCPLMDESQLEAVRELDIPGVGKQMKLVRHRPSGDSTARIVGKTGSDQTGLSGIELLCNKSLAPTNGQMKFLRDVHRTPVQVDTGDYQPPVDGGDIRLTIDLNIQEIAEEALRETVVSTNAGGGRIVVVDPHTGDILAMSDILRARRGWNEVTRDELRETDAALGRNRCATDPYEPGSTFKPFVWAWGTEHGYAKPTEMIQTPKNGPYRTSFGRSIRDVKYYGPMSWNNVLVKSLNSGMAIVSERMPHTEMQSMLQTFGFGTRVECDVPGETAGLVTAPAAWTNYTQTSVAMGHEIAVTPLQMVQAFGVFCNDGQLVPLRLVLREDETATAKHSQRQVISADVAQATRKAMAGVMTEGTGHKAQSERYQLFGKSGTAQLPKPAGQGHGYFEDRYVSSFIAGAPLDHPRLVVLCVIDDPDKKKGHFGGSIAGPVARDVLDDALQYLGVPADKSDRRKASEPSDAIVD